MSDITDALRLAVLKRAGPRPDHILTVQSGPPLPPGFEKATGKHPFFFRKWKFDAPLPPDASVHMLTNVHTFDPEYLRFLTMITELSLKHMPVDLDEEGFVGSSHIHKSTGSFGTVSGKGQTPMSYPLMDNTQRREELGLPNEWRRPRDREIFREWLHLFFSGWCDRPIKQTKKSKSGPPHMVYEVIEKKPLVEDRLTDEVFPKILYKLKARKYRDLRKDHQIIPLGVVGRRGQSDPPDKVRYAATQEYAMSGGRLGEMVRCSKEIVIDGVEYPVLGAMRMRTIVGYSTILNSMGQMMSTGHLYSLYERFPLCLKFSAIQDKVDELCANFLPDEPVLTCYAGDIDSFDACAKAEFRWKEILDVGSMYWDEGMIALQDCLHRAPYCSPPVSKDTGFFWSGNPDNPADYTGAGSLKSGENMVTVTGIIEMVGDMLTNCDYAFGNVLGNVKKILEGDYLLRLWDKGDDHKVWGAPASVAKYEEIATAEKDGKMVYSYFRSNPEAGKQIIGHIAQRLGPRKFLYIPRIHSLHDKTFANEHGIGEYDRNGVFRPSVFRPVWPIGAFVRKMLYSASNALGIYTEIRDKAWRDSGCESRYGGFNAIIDAAMDQQGTLFRLARSAQDVDVLINSAKLDYRYDDSEISPEIVALFKSTLDQDLTTGWVERLYGGSISYKR